MVLPWIIAGFVALGVTFIVWMFLRKTIKERIVTADEARTEFVSLASHQLRTPLTSLRWIMEELYHEEIGSLNEKQKHYLDVALNANNSMIEMVNDLLNLSRVETGRFIVEPVEVDLVILVQEVLLESKEFANAHDCDLVFENSPDENFLISLDKNLIREVIRNLVNNAVKYSDASKNDSYVKILLKEEGEAVYVSVADNGVGIPKESQNRVFEKFYRAQNAVKLAPGGTGLGLYVNKLIVEASGGSMLFSSKDGQGTTFTVRLPVEGSQAREGDRRLEPRNFG